MRLLERHEALVAVREANFVAELLDGPDHAVVVAVHARDADEARPNGEPPDVAPRLAAQVQALLQELALEQQPVVPVAVAPTLQCLLVMYLPL